MSDRTPIQSIVPVGYALSEVKEFLIPSEQDGSGTDPTIFDRHHTFFIIWCEDASGIAPATTMGFNVAFSKSMPLVTLHAQNEPGTVWVNTVDLPTSDGFAFQLTEAIGAIQLQIILDTDAVGDVTFYVMGVDQAAV